MLQPFSKIHFTAIGGSVMHGLAIALKGKGFQISGSDDEIYGSARANLEKAGIFPPQPGWFPEKVTPDLEALILGMHASQDNPELLKAKELGIKILSFPELVYQESVDKQRIVIAGSHGKTTITAIILHVLNFVGRDFDYIIGAQVNGLEDRVKISDAPTIVIEGDEYFSSPLDPTPKFINYHHHIGLVSGISWDHFNVYPTMEAYVEQFDHFADSTPKGGSVIYCEEDPLASVIGNKERDDVYRFPYKTHRHEVVDGVTRLIVSKKYSVPVKVFGNHNLQNISGAHEVLKRLSVSSEEFYKAIASFKGADNRLELINHTESTYVYKDYAHSPSKLLATTQALKKQFNGSELVACYELHTYSSLNQEFISQYQNCYDAPDTAIVYFNPEVVSQKNLSPIGEEDLRKAFNRKDLLIFTDSGKLKDYLLNQEWTKKNLLLMSSGNFDGLDLEEISNRITH